LTRALRGARRRKAVILMARISSSAAVALQSLTRCQHGDMKIKYRQSQAHSQP